MEALPEIQGEEKQFQGFKVKVGRKEKQLNNWKR